MSNDNSTEQTADNAVQPEIEPEIDAATPSETSDASDAGETSDTDAPAAESVLDVPPVVQAIEAPATLAAIESGKLCLDGLITHRMDAQKADAAYRTAFGDSACLKMILDWKGCA